MTPAARVEAAIEILDAVILAACSEGAPADRIIGDYFRTRRYAGSQDRRAVRELVYRVIRAIGEVPASGRAAMLAYASLPDGTDILACFDGSPHGPAPVGPDERGAAPGVVPDWLAQALMASGIDEATIAAMTARAPLDVRVNRLKAERATLALPEAGDVLPAPDGLRFSAGTPVERWDAYGQGLIEVQDLGSQLIVAALPVAPGDTVIDLCAGAGGKTLALAARMDNLGVLVASDTDRARLTRLGPRAARAGADMIAVRLLNPGQELVSLGDLVGRSDHVLIDAPCSGTGTLRRKPEAKWRLNKASLARYIAVQDRLLEIAMQLVRPGGTIGFVTCSLLDAEGPDRIAAFLAQHRGWNMLPLNLAAPVTQRGAGLRLDPLTTGSDGFFVALLQAP